MKKYLPVLLAVSLILAVSCTLSQSHLVRGKNYLDKKKYSRAISELEQAANEKGDIYYYLDTYSWLGDAYRKSSQENNAISVYRNALQIIHLRIRALSSRRHNIRRELNSGSGLNLQDLQNEDMLLGQEEGQLKERGEDIRSKLDDLLNVAGQEEGRSE